MRWRVGIGFTGSVLGIGFELFLDLFGTRRIIDETVPMLSAFLPLTGIGLISGTVFFAAVMVCIGIRRYFANLTETTIEDLENFILAHERPRRRYPSQNEIAQCRARIRILGNKYSNWLADSNIEGEPEFGRESEGKARHYIETVKAHGYFKARRIICKQVKKKPT